MRTIDVKAIEDKIKEELIDLCENISPNILKRLKEAYFEEKDLAKSIIEKIIENDELARKNHIPICQDTGTVICFIEIGNEVMINGDINKAINDGISKAYTEGFLRKSMVKDPLNRLNTQDNTPGIIYTKYKKGDDLTIKIMVKGAGSENMGVVKMMVPSDGIEKIKEFIIETVKNNALKTCPPIILGVGIGGNLEKASLMAKEALFRDIEDHNEDPFYAKLESDLKESINKLNIGPMGLGGKTTCLAVKVDCYPCHIASLPVAINFECHAARHKIIKF